MYGVSLNHGLDEGNALFDRKDAGDGVGKRVHEKQEFNGFLPKMMKGRGVGDGVRMERGLAKEGELVLVIPGEWFETRLCEAR